MYYLGIELDRGNVDSGEGDNNLHAENVENVENAAEDENDPCISQTDPNHNTVLPHPYNQTEDEPSVVAWHMKNYPHCHRKWHCLPWELRECQRWNQDMSTTQKKTMTKNPHCRNQSWKVFRRLFRECLEGRSRIYDGCGCGWILFVVGWRIDFDNC